MSSRRFWTVRKYSCYQNTMRAKTVQEGLTNWKHKEKVLKYIFGEKDLKLRISHGMINHSTISLFPLTHGFKCVRYTLNPFYYHYIICVYMFHCAPFLFCVSNISIKSLDDLSIRHLLYEINTSRPSNRYEQSHFFSFHKMCGQKDSLFIQEILFSILFSSWCWKSVSFLASSFVYK